MPRRIVFDIRSLVESIGPSDGIVRTVRALARYAAASRPDVVFAIFDPNRHAFRSVDPRWLTSILNGSKVDTSHFIDPLGHRKPWRARLPLALRHAVHAMARPRRRAFVWLEGRRARATGPAPLLDRIQIALMSGKLAAELRGQGDGRRLLLPFDLAMEPPLKLAANDVVFVAGFNWSALYEISAYVARPGAPQLAVFCHDIIPLMFPDFYHARDVARFRACFHAAFPASRLVIFSTQRVQSDVIRYCRDHALPLAATAVVALGADGEPSSAPSALAADLPPGLRPQQFLLFVSTIEPRKNHMLLLRVWSRLLEERVPQAAGFKMVFVGRRGWKSDDIVAAMHENSAFGESLVHLIDVSDAELAALYSNAAFCVYPSLYEGFGLPLIEGFRRGKAVIASNGGALPETSMGLSPSLDPNDETAWLAMLRSWIVEPRAREPYELAIRQQFKVREWTLAAAEIFAEIDRMGGGE